MPDLVAHLACSKSREEWGRIVAIFWVKVLCCQSEVTARLVQQRFGFLSTLEELADLNQS